MYACINVIASTISSAPLKFLKKNVILKRGEHELYDLFNPPKRPGIPTLRELLYRTFVHMGIDGICYWVFYLEGGKLANVDLKLKKDLTPVLGKNGALLGWVEKRNSVVVAKYDTDMVIPMRYYNPNDPLGGLSPLGAAALSVAQENNIAEWNSSFFKSGMRTPMVLETAKTLTPKQRRDLRKDIGDYYTGSTNGHGAFIADGGIKATPMPLSSKDIDFIEGKQLTREEICAVFGIPPAIVGIFRYSNYSNTKEQRRIFWEQTLLPKMRSLTENIQINLLDSRYADVTIDWDLNDVYGLKPDMLEVSASAKTYFDMGYNHEQIALILDTPLLNPKRLLSFGAKPTPQEELGLYNPAFAPTLPNAVNPPKPVAPKPPAVRPNPTPKPNRPTSTRPKPRAFEGLFRRYSKTVKGSPSCDIEKIRDLWDASVEKEFFAVCQEGVLNLSRTHCFDSWKSHFEKDEEIFKELKGVLEEIKSRIVSLKDYDEDSVVDSVVIDFFGASVYNLSKFTAMKLSGAEKAIVFSEDGSELEVVLKSCYPTEAKFFFKENGTLVFKNHSILPVLEV